MPFIESDDENASRMPAARSPMQALACVIYPRSGCRPKSRRPPEPQPASSWTSNEERGVAFARMFGQMSIPSPATGDEPAPYWHGCWSFRLSLRRVEVQALSRDTYPRSVCRLSVKFRKPRPKPARACHPPKGWTDNCNDSNSTSLASLVVTHTYNHIGIREGEKRRDRLW